MREENLVDADAGQPEMPGNLWGMDVDVAVCDRCYWAFVVERGGNIRSCPYCSQGSLVIAPIEQEGWSAYARPPEAYLPHTEPVEMVNRAVGEFAGGLWFPPLDLTPQNLVKRVKRVFLPMWLVDSRVEASWEAETGFNYQVVSHQDHFNENRSGWESREVRETRIRWEKRLGRLKREYANISAPALDEHRKIMQRTGAFKFAGVQPYTRDVLRDAFLRLPDRPMEDAWPEAVDALKQAAAEECCRAAGADHVRQFQWEPAFSDQNWTLLLLPVYLTYYLDDDGRPQQILLNGQTGQLSGQRRASMKRAQQAALWVLAAAVLVFMLSLALLVFGIVLPPVMAIGGLGILLSLLIGLGAILPPAIAWNVNRKVNERR